MTKQSPGPPLFSGSLFTSTTVPTVFLGATLGGIYFFVLLLIVAMVYCRHRHEATHWKKLKYCCSSLDVFFRSRHHNETPSVMVHRKSVIGGFQSILFPVTFVVVAIYIGIAWNANPITTSAVLPFGHIANNLQPRGQFTVSALFWGFAGDCSLASVQINAVGFSTTPVIRVQATPLYCNVTWDTFNVATPVSPVVSRTGSRVHCVLSSNVHRPV